MLLITVKLGSTYTSDRSSSMSSFLENIDQLDNDRNEDKHRGGLQFGIDPSILLVGSMPKQLM